MQIERDTFAMIHDCENAVHNTFKKHSGDPQALSNDLGYLHTEFGREAVMMAMVSCMKIAYIRLYGPKN